MNAFRNARLSPAWADRITSGTTKNADDFLLLGEYVVEGHYKDSKFSKFRRERAAEAS